MSDKKKKEDLYYSQNETIAHNCKCQYKNVQF